MKYYYEKPEVWVGAGKTYSCNHRFYNTCTLFCDDEKGLAIVQERFNKETKARWWGPVDPWLAGDIFLHPEFNEFFEENAAEPTATGLYPTFPVRKIMWALRMKPLRKEFWEEVIL